MSRFAYAEISRLLQPRYHVRELNPVSCTASALLAARLAALARFQGFLVSYTPLAFCATAPENPVHGSVTSFYDSLRPPSCVRGRGTAGGKHGRSVKQAPTAAWWLGLAPKQRKPS